MGKTVHDYKNQKSPTFVSNKEAKKMKKLQENKKTTGTILEVKPTLTPEELMKLMQMQTKSRIQLQEEKSYSKTATKSITKKSTTQVTPPTSKHSQEIEITDKK